MAGIKEFGLELRKTDSITPTDPDHYRLDVAMDTLWVLDDDGTLGDIAVNKITANSLELSGGNFIFDDLGVNFLNVVVEANVSGNLTVIGDASFDDGLFQGDLSTWGDGYFGGDLIIDDQITVSGDSVFLGRTDVSDNFYIGGANFFDIISNITVDSLSVTGAVIVNDISVSGDAIFGSTVDAMELTVQDKANILGDLEVGLDLKINRDAEVDRNLTVRQDAKVDRNLFVEGVADFNAIVLIDNELHVGQTIFSHNDLVVDGDIFVSGGINGIDDGLGNSEVSLVSGDWAFIPYTDMRGSVMIVIAGQTDGHPAATFMASSALSSGVGSVARITSSAAANGDELEIRWQANSDIEVRLDQVSANNTNNGVYSFTCVKTEL